jgi:hypothetical protein
LPIILAYSICSASAACRRGRARRVGRGQAPDRQQQQQSSSDSSGGAEAQGLDGISAFLAMAKLG